METPKLTIGIIPQPEFPLQDLTESNAQLLSVMLANQAIVHGGHEAAERTSWLFKVGHPALRIAAMRLLTEQRQTEVFSHGIAVYESMTALIKQDITQYSDFVVNINASAVAGQLPDEKLRDHIDNAAQRFIHEMPHAAEVVSEVTERFYRGAGRFALFGAASARQFELDAAA